MEKSDGNVNAPSVLEGHYPVKAPLVHRPPHREQPGRRQIPRRAGV